mgnify:CR=1 FL=1
MNKFSNRAYALLVLIAIAFCMVLIATFTFATDVALAADESGEIVPVVSLTYGDETKEFTSFDAALEALKYIPIDSDEKTVRFLEDDVTIGNFDLSSWHRVFTLDLNGKRVVGSPSLIAAGSLTIRDSSAEQTGTLDLSTSSINCRFDEFVFESGTLKLGKYSTGTYTIMFVDQTKTTTIRGGCLEAHILVGDAGNLQVEGGSIKELEVRNQASIKGGTIDKLIVATNAQILSGGTILGFKLESGATFKSMLCEGYAYQKADGSAMVKSSEMTAETAVNVVKCSHDSFTVSNGEHVCDYCGYICTHEKYDKDECALCRQACAHEGVDENNRVCSECGGTMNIAVSDGTTTRYYVDFAYASKQLADGDRMTLLSNVVLDYRDDNSIYKNITLDLNGKTQRGIYISIKASVTIIDSKDGGKVCFATSDNANVIYDCGPNTVAMIQHYIGKITCYNGKIDLINFANGHTFDEIVPTGYVVKYFDGTEIRKIAKDAVKDCTIAANSGQYVLIEKCDHSVINSDLTCNYCGMDLGSILAGANADLKKAQSDLQSAIDEKADTQTVNDLVTKLNEAIANAEVASKSYADAKDSEVKNELNDNISSAKNNAIKAANDALDAAKKELGDLIDQKVSSQELLDAIDTLNDAIANAETASNAYADSKDNVVKELMTAAIASAKADAIQSANEALDVAKTQLSAKIDSKASANEVNAAIAELNNAIATAETVSKAYADDKNAELKDELESKIEDSKAEVAAAINALSERLGAVESKIEENAQKTDTLQTVLIVFIVLLALANVATVVVFSLHKRR